MRRADLSNADLSNANIRNADFFSANLRSANLSVSNLRSTSFRSAKIHSAKLCRADLRSANFTNAKLNGADLTNATLQGAVFVNTCIQDTILNSWRVYGASVWDSRGTPSAKSRDFIITPPDQPEVTVDNLEVAQFVYLLLTNKKIRDVLDTIGKKGILILGRFTQERKEVLDALRDKLRTLDFVPMMFDYEGSTTKDFTETVKILAGMSRFIIADITSPKSSPIELQTVVPDYKVPFVPIIQEGEEPFSMFANLQNYPWMFDVLQYKDRDQLMAVIDKAIIQPALVKADELNVQKAEDVRKRHASDYL